MPTVRFRKIEKVSLLFPGQAASKRSSGTVHMGCSSPPVGHRLAAVPQDKRTKTWRMLPGRGTLGSHAWRFLPCRGTPTRVTLVPSRIPDVASGRLERKQTHGSQLFSMPGCRQESEYLLCSLFLYSYKELSPVWGQLFSSCAESWQSVLGKPPLLPI